MYKVVSGVGFQVLGRRLKPAGFIILYHLSSAIRHLTPKLIVNLLLNNTHSGHIRLC